MPGCLLQLTKLDIKRPRSPLNPSLDAPQQLSSPNTATCESVWTASPAPKLTPVNPEKVRVSDMTDTSQEAYTILGTY